MGWLARLRRLSGRSSATVRATVRLHSRRSFELDAVDLGVIRQGILPFGNPHLLGRVQDTGPSTLRGYELNGVIIHLRSRHDLSRRWIPGGRLRAPNRRVQTSIEILDCVLCAAGRNELNGPTDRAIVVCPPELGV